MLISLISHVWSQTINGANWQPHLFPLVDWIFPPSNHGWTVLGFYEEPPVPVLKSLVFRTVRVPVPGKIGTLGPVLVPVPVPGKNGTLGPVLVPVPVPGKNGTLGPVPVPVPGNNGTLGPVPVPVKNGTLGPVLVQFLKKKIQISIPVATLDLRPGLGFGTGSGTGFGFQFLKCYLVSNPIPVPAIRPGSSLVFY
jgi:hypothetical protein